MRLIALSVLLLVHLSAETQPGKESIELRSVRHFNETKNICYHMEGYHNAEINLIVRVIKF